MSFSMKIFTKSLLVFSQNILLSKPSHRVRYYICTLTNYPNDQFWNLSSFQSNINKNQFLHLLETKPQATLALISCKSNFSLRITLSHIRSSVGVWCPRYRKLLILMQTFPHCKFLILLWIIYTKFLKSFAI